ncbi:YndM family protein [Barrientosiimonas marina]|uniref:DUF2512 family protein n=1 Tax=Lentibacillus kimchii TaxID=1542911 RepID=A0ABW2UU30_9BACI
MVYLKALGIKFIVVGITVFSLFGIFYHASVFSLFGISLLTTTLSFVIGDLFVLKKFGNIAASIADFPLGFLSLFLFGGLFIMTGTSMAAIAFMGAFFMALCEPFIHAYLIENLEEEALKKQGPFSYDGQFQTEFAEEFESDDKDQKNDDRQ